MVILPRDTAVLHLHTVNHIRSQLFVFIVTVSRSLVNLLSVGEFIVY